MQLAISLQFRCAKRVRILKGGVVEGKAVGDQVLFSAEPGDFASLGKALRVVGIPIPLRCMCCGTYAIEFWRGDSLLTTVGYHHHLSLRHPLFPGDAKLWDSGGLAHWLAERGVDEVLEDLHRGNED